MILKRFFLLIFLVGFAACSKDGLPKTYVYLQINKLASGDNILIENSSAIWDSAGGYIELNASGYNLEYFKLKLDNITGTGIVPFVTLENIFYFEANDFYPTSLDEVTIEITQVSSVIVSGNFFVSFLTFDRLSNKIAGRFEIINK